MHDRGFFESASWAEYNSVLVFASEAPMIFSAFLATADPNGAAAPELPLLVLGLWFSGASAFIAALAMIANFLAVRTATRIRESEVLVDLTEKYRSKEMNAALKAIGDASKHRNWVAKWDEARRSRDESALVLDDHRRLIKGYFETVAILLRGGFIRRDVAVAAVDRGGVRIFLELVEPMERIMNPSNYPKWIWDTIRPLPVQFDVGGVFDSKPTTSS